MKHDVPFAYDLDGGSSTQTTYYNQILMPIYRDTTGRRIPTIITFEEDYKNSHDFIKITFP